ncbi:DUF4230 domain-containing protein [Patescibacteria group bacterium]|nr:MAG: DUF4230 domain-containing protein [Patescibacteria group bacterium]
MNYRLIAIGGVVLFLSGLLAGYKLFAPGKAPAAASSQQLILTTLHDRGFLVTQTYIFDQPAVIKKSAGSALKDFFFGQTIAARGTMEVNLGIDLGKVEAGDVEFAADTVTVRVPAVSLFNTRLVGPVEVKNSQGLLKKLFDSDDGYNEALAALSRAAEEAAGRPELVERATARAKEDVERLLIYFLKDKKIIISVK